MTDRLEEEERASREAADWMARLNQRSVDSRTIEDFYAWRRRPDNGAAYERLEALWSKAEPLNDDHDIAVALGRALRPRGWLARLRALMGFRSGALLASALVMLVLSGTLFWAIQPISYETKVGEQRLVMLDDGSRIRLNTDSRIALHFSKRERRIDLDRGQAFFAVAHDRTRPFVVRAGEGQVTALGTRFDVRRDGDDVRVLLAEGEVGVAAGASSDEQRLTPGYATMIVAGRVMRPEKADIESATAWTAGRIQFTDTPLETAVAEINRYTAHSISLQAPALAQARVNGVFETGDIPAFVSAVTALFPLRAVAESDGGTRLVPTD